MSGKTFVIICSLLFVQFASGRITRDAPAEQETDLFDQLKTVINSVQEKVFQSTGVDNQEQFNKLIGNGATKLADDLTKISTEIKRTTEENIESIGNSDAVQKLRARIDEAVNDLKKQNPETAKNFEQLSKTTNSLITEISKLGESDSAKQIKDIGNKILETSADVLKDVNNKILEATKPKN